MKRIRPIFWALAAAIVAAGALHADPAEEERLRATLRSTMQQLQDAQNQLATLQAQQSEAADDKKAMEDQLSTARRRLAELQADSGRSISELRAKAAEQSAEIDRLTRANAEWKAAQAQSATAAHSAADERDRLQRQNALLQRRLDDLKTRNLALYDLGNQILTRFEKFSLGDQFMAKEPFIGRSRVRLENLIQDYGDKLKDQLADR